MYPSFPCRERARGRLLTLALLYADVYEVGRYMSLERIIEQTKETTYDARLSTMPRFAARQTICAPPD